MSDRIDIDGPDILTSTAPERIWLQVDTMGDDEDRSEPFPAEPYDDVTWQHESIGGQEVVYIRADKYDALASELRELRQASALLGRELFRFRSFNDWVNHAKDRFAECGVPKHEYISVDAKRRICTSGKEFMRARDDESFPIIVHAIQPEPTP